MNAFRRLSQRCLRLLAPLVKAPLVSLRRSGFLWVAAALQACGTTNVSSPAVAPTRLLIDIFDSDGAMAAQTICVFDPRDQTCRFSSQIPDFRLYQRSVSGEVSRDFAEATTLVVRLFRFDNALVHQSHCTFAPEAGSTYGTCRLSAVVEASSPLRPEGDAPRRFNFVLTLVL